MIPSGRKSSPFMRTDEVAAYWGVHPDTVRAWARKGRLRSRRTPGGQQRRYLRVDVETLDTPVETEPTPSHENGPAPVSDHHGEPFDHPTYPQEV